MVQKSYLFWTDLFHLKSLWSFGKMWWSAFIKLILSSISDTSQIPSQRQRQRSPLRLAPPLRAALTLPSRPLPGPSTATTRIATGETSPPWGPTHQRSDPTRQHSSPTHQPAPQLADNPPQVGSLNAKPGDVRIRLDNLVAWALPGSNLAVYLIGLAKALD